MEYIFILISGMETEESTNEQKNKTKPDLQNLVPFVTFKCIRQFKVGKVGKVLLQRDPSIQEVLN